MKMKRPHRVPLSAAALAIVERQRQGNRGPFVFPGRGGGAIGKSSLHRALFALVGDALRCARLPLHVSRLGR